MELVRVPIDPYWINAVFWYVDNCIDVTLNRTQHEELIEYEKWFERQGAEIIRNGDYYPWLHFNDPILATAFMLKWA